MERKLYQEHELEAYLGEHMEDFDVEAIVDEATEIDPRTGNRYWKDGIDDVDIAEICERHDKTQVTDYRGKRVDFEAAVQLMDDEIRERLHDEGIEDNQEFFERYAEAHAEKFDGDEFAPYYGGAW